MKISDRNAPTEALKDVVKKYKTGTALDLGAGTGRNSLYLAAHGFQVTAVDSGGDALQQLRTIARKKKLKVATVQKTMGKFTTRERFTVVLAVGALHFLTPKQVPEVVAKMQRYTKPGGCNVVIAHTNKNKESSRPYLFKHNELRHYYSDWQLVRYEEKLGRAWRSEKTGKIVQRHIAILVAQQTK